MDASIILVILVAAGLGWAFYTGHLHGISSAMKSVVTTMRDQANAHASLADELRTARDTLRALITPRKPVAAVGDAAAAVAAAKPQDIAMLKPAAEPVPAVDPVKAAQKALIDKQIAGLQADRAALG